MEEMDLEMVASEMEEFSGFLVKDNDEPEVDRSSLRIALASSRSVFGHSSKRVA